MPEFVLFTNVSPKFILFTKYLLPEQLFLPNYRWELVFCLPIWSIDLFHFLYSREKWKTTVSYIERGSNNQQLWQLNRGEQWWISASDAVIYISIRITTIVIDVTVIPMRSKHAEFCIENDMLVCLFLIWESWK